MKNEKYLLKISLVAAIGSFLFGFDTAVISGTTETLQEIYNLSSFSLGFTISSALIGTIVGAIFSGKMADKYSRKTTLKWMALFYFISALGCAFSTNWYMFIAFRFIGGIGVGGASVVCPMYIAEISTKELRGRLVALSQLNIVLGILMAFVSNYIISLLELGALEWKWMFGVEALPALLFLVFLYIIPNSPRWLVFANRSKESFIVLHKIRNDEELARKELQSIEASFDRELPGSKESIFQAQYIKLILLAVAITAFNQMSGINAILYYAPRVFKLTGAASESALIQSIIIGIVNLVFTMFALFAIDKLGRKKLMLIGSVGYIISLLTAGTIFLVSQGDFSSVGATTLLLAIVVFIASHAFGQGAVVWVFVSEIFPNSVRAQGQSIASLSIWIFSVVVSQAFPMLLDSIGPAATFYFFGGFMVLQLFWVIFIMPETKGISLEKIKETLIKKNI